MAIKTYFGPYVCDPGLASEAGMARQARATNWFNRFCRAIRAVVAMPDESASAPPAGTGRHWAYRVVNRRENTAAATSFKCQRQLRYAVELPDLELEAIEPADLRPGDTFVVDAGQTIFADGIILAGSAVVDESAVTGQSEPQVCTAEVKSSVLRHSQVVGGQILVQIAAQRGHPLDWIETPSGLRRIAQPALQRAAVRS